MFGMSRYDQWATASPPDDGYDTFCENVGEALSDLWWKTHEDWFIDSDEANNKLNEIFINGIFFPDFKQINTDESVAIRFMLIK